MSIAEGGLPMASNAPGPTVPGNVQQVGPDPQTASFFKALGQAMKGFGGELEKFPNWDPIQITRFSGMLKQAQGVWGQMQAQGQPQTMDQRVGIGAASPAGPTSRRVDGLTGQPLADRARAMMANRRGM